MLWRRSVVALLGLALTACPYLMNSTMFQPIAPSESPRPIEGVNSPDNDYNAAAQFQTAQVELIFSSDRGGGRRHYDLWFAKVNFELERTYVVGVPTPYLPAAMSPGNEFGPALVGEGVARRLVFSSDREGGHGKLDLWFYPLSKEHEPRPLAGVNSGNNEAYWTSLPGASDAYFASDRERGRYDIYRLSPAFGGEKPTIERVSRLASSADETAPHIFTQQHRYEQAPAVSLNPGRKREAASVRVVTKTYLLFASNRGKKTFDLYCTRLDASGWSTPRPFPPEINTDSDEFRPIVALGGQIIVFSSNRPGGKGGMDLYYARFENPCG